MYEIHFNDNTGITGLTQLCDVRLNIALQAKNNGRTVEKILKDGAEIVL